MSRRTTSLLAGAVLLGFMGMWWMLRRTEDVRLNPDATTSTDATIPADTTYAGSQTCASCHQTQAAAWRASQHARAMAEPTPETVLGRFDNQTFQYAGTTSTFSRRDAAFIVRTDGPDGKLADYPVAYTFGVAPLQQYLLRLPGGRLQALGIAWDARPATAGGQRWFHLYPRDALKAGDPLHWTGLQQNWNFMCADCHSTRVQKGYDPSTREFRTTWSEISVGCEACHGPGDAHVKSGGKARLAVRFDEHKTPIASRPPAQDREVEVCARCHARRSQLTDNAHAGDRFENAFRSVLLEPALFYSDGQQKDEVYDYASFLQSKMHAKGVTCADCHDPHSGRTRFEGNALCTQCHAANAFDAPSHHFHKAGTPAASCPTCHMPTTTYMQVDPRHDHSLKVPRPDLTVKAGVPNACTIACHANRSPSWAADQIEQRRDLSRPPAMAGAAPAIVRASAIARLDAADPVNAAALEAALADASPLVRRGALAALADASPELRLRLAPKMLTDPIRAVRTEAVHALLDVADQSLSGSSRADFDRAFDEFLAEQRFNADRPEAQTSMGTAWLTRGRANLAIPALMEAIRLDRTFVPAYVNLADAYQTAGNESSAEKTLREGLAVAPKNAALHHALGLALVRQKQMASAMKELAEAVRLGPDVPRFTYTYIVALYDTGRRDEALRLLRAALRTMPNDAGVKSLAAEYLR